MSFSSVNTLIVSLAVSFSARVRTLAFMICVTRRDPLGAQNALWDAMRGRECAGAEVNTITP